MTDGNSNFNRLDALRRYVSPAVWAIVISVILIIPLKIISDGYLPGDDALRHAAKAVSGKPWGDILVLGPAFRDQNFVWHFFLRQIFLWSHCDIDQLVIFAVAGLFTLFAWSPLPWLKRPEAWLITLTIVTLTSGVIMQRLMLGRPFLLTLSGVMTILCAWQFRGTASPRWWTLVWITALIALCTLVHGIWYLWALLVAAFFLAGQFRWGIMLAIGWLAGAFWGASFTGHPIDSLSYAVEIARRTLGMHDIQNTMTAELQSFTGDVLALMVIGGLLILRCLCGLNTRPWKSNPAFWLVCLCWLLGFKANRFWEDWGWPALMVLTTGDLQLLLEARFAADSLKRLALTGGLAVMTYMAITNDYNSRWTHNLTWSYLTQDNPDLNGWLPEHDGIFYTADMNLFFQTFFKNPNADWKYILGYEPALMPDQDFAVYRRVLWNFGDAKAYQPWVDKMRPADRLVVRGAGGAPPNIPQFEWKYGVSGIWLGRVPQTNAPPQNPPPSVPAAAARESSTHPVNSAK